jgi:Na+/H+ antiporter NhaD/arsenite permease-like protein
VNNPNQKKPNRTMPNSLSTFWQNLPPAVVGNLPPLWAALPFALLLAAIAVVPLLPSLSHWWDSNLHRLLVVSLLAAVTVAYYLFWHAAPIEAKWPVHHTTPPAARGPNWAQAGDIVTTALLSEYLPFILLLFSLYTISGGIRVEGQLRGTPAGNAAFLAAGTLLASLVGTTGAAMLLIRPLLEANRGRARVAHTVVFFIFTVCNCGGCLLPIGDPPLFLGYLLGVSFFWTLRLWPEWLFVNGVLLAVYYWLDRYWHSPREAPAPLSPHGRGTIGDGARGEGIVFERFRICILGLWPNAPLLAAVVAAVVLLSPAAVIPGTNWHPWLGLREAALVALVVLSLIFSRPEIRRRNQFDYAPIIEVAILFFGVFICMQPPLEIIAAKGPALGLLTPTQFFWTTGGLSAVLDNAPTYVVFFQAAKALGGPAAIAGVAEPLLKAISLAAVFLGAATYIGNGPNFMVKAIAERAAVRMPGFFGYLKYSIIILLPLMAAANWIFLR